MRRAVCKSGRTFVYYSVNGSSAVHGVGTSSWAPWTWTTPVLTAASFQIEGAPPHSPRACYVATHETI